MNDLASIIGSCSSLCDSSRVRSNGCDANWGGAIQLEAWVIDDTGFKNDGTSPPCVARQYSGTLGNMGNCYGVSGSRCENEHRFDSNHFA